MLDLAIKHASQLQYKYINIINTPKFKYYMSSPIIEYELPIYTNSQDRLQFVSLLETGEVIGYFGAKLNLLTNTAYDLEIINFVDKNSTFTSDLFNFVDTLYKDYGVDRVVFNVIIGNPAEKLYDRLMNTCGGRVIGVFKNDVRLPDGKLYDVKYYEMFKDSVYQKINDRKINSLTYRDFGRGEV